MVEFVLAGIASATMLISTVQLAIGMWNYHTLAYGIHEVTRYASVRGKGCTNPGNTCSVSIGTLAHKLASLSIGVPASAMNVTFTTESGAQTSCNPLTSCFSDATIWPPATNHDNSLGKMIKVEGRYQYNSALIVLWPGVSSPRFGTFVLPASSTQTLVY